MALSRSLTSGSGGVGTAQAQVVIAGKGNSGDLFSFLSDLWRFPNSVLSMGTFDTVATTNYALSTPTGARAVIVQAPYGNTVVWDVSDAAGSRSWEVAADGVFFSTIPAATTSVNVYSTTAIAGFRYAFL
jgi:hypothetical protein